ncbi:hypothetical protein D9M72_274810 [compost metagenome]
MVGRALDGEVQCQLQAMSGRRVAQAAEVFKGAELGMQRIVAAFLAADGVGAAVIARLGTQAVVAALAVGAADRVDRREVEHVEAHRANGGQPGDDIVEGAVAGLVVALRAREQLVPAGVACGQAIGLDRHGHRMTRGKRAPRRGCHHCLHRGRRAWRQQDLLPAGVIAGSGGQFVDDG